MTTKLPSIFDLPPAEHEHRVPEAEANSANLIARAALYCVCRHWSVEPAGIYSDRRHTHNRQARTALCLLISGNTRWTRNQIARFTGRRAHTRIVRDISAAGQWPTMDKHYPERMNRAARDLKAMMRELDSALAGPASAPSPLAGEGRGEGSKRSAEGGAA